ncbi:alpha/beta-hydrolase, partial [Ramicandelaber brevisporus]
DTRSLTPATASQIKDLGHYSEFAKAAYEKDMSSAVKSATGADVTKTFQGKLETTRGYVAYDKQRNQVVVGYEGTHNLASALVDANADQVSYGKTGAKVHRGFLQSTRETEGQVFAEVDRLRKEHPGATTAFVGHSLGGAQAVVAASDYAQKAGPRGISVRTYGQPAVGDPKFANYYDNLGLDSKRVTNNKDAVPQVPSNYLNYHH